MVLRQTTALGNGGPLGQTAWRGLFDRNSEVPYKKACALHASPRPHENPANTARVTDRRTLIRVSTTADATPFPQDEEHPMSTGDILTKRDVAELLQVSERTVERWMSEGSIPYVPLPKRGAWSEARFL